MHRLLRLILSGIVSTTFVLAHAQSVRWSPDSGSLAQSQNNELKLVYESCEPSAEPSIPSVNGLMLQRVGQSSSYNNFNGRMTQTVVLNYLARPSERDPLTIPSFAVETNKGKLTVPAVSFEVGEARVGASGASLASIANSKLTTPKEVWAGEVFPITYTLSISGRKRFGLGGNMDWNSSPLIVESWPGLEKSETVTNGEPRVLITSHTRAMAKNGGAITLNATTQIVNIATSVDFFGNPTGEPFSINSDRPTLNVKPLPGGEPANFNGAVGQFTLESKVVPATLTVGEPLTWTLTLSGTGNWPDISGLPARDASKDFKVVQPQAKRTLKEGTTFEGTLVEDVILIPTKPGTYVLGPYTWSYFDPAKNRYETVTTGKTTVTVGAAPINPIADASANNTAATKTAPKQLAAPPSLPTKIPRDPLPGKETAHVPLSSSTLTIILLSPLPVLLGLWLWLALGRARKTDPLRPQREARARLAATLAELRNTKETAQIHILLQSWQQDVRVLWQIPHAVPAGTHFVEDATTGRAMAALWNEAERTLYRAATSLPADWITRAESALAAKTLKPFSIGQLFRPRNLLPFAALFALLVVAPAPQAQAADGRYSYDRGDFSEAEKIWRESIKKEPLDWIARHNLALSLAQQNRWSEAAAHATAAFIQQPANPAVQWHFALTLEQAGYTPTTLSNFVKPSPAYEFARQASPGEWQCVLIASAILAALCLAALLIRTYLLRSAWITPVAWSVFALSLCMVLIAFISLRLYAPAVDQNAAIVWRATTLRSIPTEADTTQKTTPLAAGSIARIDKNFLGWNRLAFTNGQTGWVRQEDVVKLWQ